MNIRDPQGLAIKKNRIALAVEVAMSASTFVLALPYASTALAQDNILEEILITGSRIARPDLDSVSPYVVVSGEEFKLSDNLCMANC